MGYKKNRSGKKVKKQYFSKLHKKWMDLKTTDSEKELRKYGYRIRVIPIRKSRGK